jgi:hypothetical protein
MKQNITVEQLSSLNNTGKESLHNWFRDKKGVDWVSTTEVWIGGTYLPELSIGEMIEFLFNHVGFNLDYSNADSTWGVMFDEKEFGNKELCDALWEACKSVLERK